MQYIAIVVPRYAVMGSVDSDMSRMLLIISLVSVGLLLLGWMVFIHFLLPPLTYPSLSLSPTCST